MAYCNEMSKYHYQSGSYQLNDTEWLYLIQVCLPVTEPSVRAIWSAIGHPE